MPDREELERLKRFWEHTRDCYDAVGYYDLGNYYTMDPYNMYLLNREQCIKRKLNRCIIGLPVKITNKYYIEVRHLKSDIGIIVDVNTKIESVVVRANTKITAVGTTGPIELCVNLTLGLDEFELLEAGI